MSDDVTITIWYTYMDGICNPYGKHICINTIWAPYDIAIGVITLYKVAQMVRGDAPFNVNFGVKVNPPVPKPSFRSSLVLQLQLL